MTTHDTDAPRTCVNHPDRPTQARIDEEYFCEECIGPAYERWKEWLASFRVVRGGVEALR